LLREIPDEFWPALQRFDSPQDEMPRDELHQRMLYFLHVFEYQNGRPWYEVRPSDKNAGAVPTWLKTPGLN
jgi:hypothetical protein